MTMSPVLVERDGGQHFHFLNTLQTAKLTSEQTNGALTVVEFVGTKNFGPPLHMHDAEVCARHNIQVLGPPPTPID
jgi:hypothetical protein